MPTLVSVLTLTCPGRERFARWASWNIGKQTSWDFEILSEPGDGTIAEKRNRLLDAARGDVIVWFDDDDWQHPDRVAWATELVKSPAVAMGPLAGFMIDPKTREAWLFSGSRPLFNGLAVLTSVARAVRFGPTDDSDGLWVEGVLSRGRWVPSPMTFAWLVHSENTCIRPRELPLRGVLRQKSLEDVRAALGQAWGDTDTYLSQIAEAA